MNPSALSIAIRSSYKDDSLAHHVRWNLIGGKQCCDFYSCFLMKSLRDVNLGWEEKRSYRIYGKVNEKEGLALFPMRDSFDIDSMEGE